MDQHQKQRVRKSLVFVLAACLCGCIVVCGTGCTKHKKQVAESIADIQKREGVPVRAITVQPGCIAAVENAGGTAEGIFQSSITAIANGRITQINVKVGDYVEKNASLMTIVPDAAQTFAVSKVQLDNAEKARDRIKALVAQGGASQEMLDNAETELAVAREAVGSMEKSEFVLAPFAGTITAVYPSPNSIIAKEKPLIDIARLDKIRLSVTVSELIINRFKTGQPATVVVGSDTIRGTVGEVSLAGSANHTFTLDVMFDNKNHVIKPGMYLTANVVVAQKNGVLSLPLETVLSDGTEHYVYVIIDGTAYRVSVVPGMRGDDHIEIKEGLHAGDMVVTEGATNLSENTKVKIVP